MDKGKNSDDLVRETGAVRKDNLYTYSDYLTWDDSKRYELIDGVVYDMTPAPSRNHQKILRELFLRFGNYLDDKECQVYPAPFDVRLPEGDEDDKDITNEEITNVVQPDLVVICDLEKLDDRGCLGAPDLVIEIISPGSAVKDKKTKLNLYEKAGIQEYWIVDGEKEIVELYLLNEDNGKKEYTKPEIYTAEDELPVSIFAGDLLVDFGEVFAE